MRRLCSVLQFWILSFGFLGPCACDISRRVYGHDIWIWQSDMDNFIGSWKALSLLDWHKSPNGRNRHSSPRKPIDCRKKLAKKCSVKINQKSIHSKGRSTIISVWCGSQGNLVQSSFAYDRICRIDSTALIWLKLSTQPDISLHSWARAKTHMEPLWTAVQVVTKRTRRVCEVDYA